MANSPFLRAFSPSQNQPDDVKWKTYASNVDQSMKGWDNIRVWADYIFYLQKLGKSLRANPGKTQNIPHSRVVAQRLSECLRPDISSGVHLKAIDVYNIVFDILGDQISTEIGLWFPGMASILAYTDSTTMHPAANLFQRLVTVLPSLRGILRPLLLALLSGLEDEGSEIFGKVFDMVDEVKLKVNDDAHFWQCFFLTIISSPARRMGALAYANRRFPNFSAVNGKKLDDLEDRGKSYQLLDYEAQMAINPDPGLMIRAFCKGLQDENLLVQRGFMELLVQNVPLDSVALQVIAHDKDLQMLCTDACSTVLKREMSLNRRLWSWLLGPDPDPDSSLANAAAVGQSSNTSKDGAPLASRSGYFLKFAYQHLVDGLMGMINQSTSDPAVRTKPYRICVSILDRWEIGGAVIPKVFIPTIKSVKQYGEEYPDGLTDVLNSAGSFFDATETINIGHDLLQLVLALDSESLELLEYVLNHFHVGDDELKVTHLPLILLALLIKHDDISDKRMWFQCCEKLVEIIPDFAYLPVQYDKNPAQRGQNQELLAKILKFYSAANDAETDAEAGSGPFSIATLTKFILSQLAHLCTENSRSERYYDLLAGLVLKIPENTKWRDDQLIRALVSSGKGVKLFGLIFHGMTAEEIDDYVTAALCRIWSLLALPNSGYPVESVREIWQIQESLDNLRVESGLAALFLKNDGDPIDQMRAFSRLWAHSIDRANYSVVLTRLVFLVLDKLESEAGGEEDDDWALLVRAWLDSIVSQRSSSKLFNILSAPILNTSFVHDAELFKYHIDILNCVLTSHHQLRQLYFKNQEQNYNSDSGSAKPLEKVVSTVLVEYLDTQKAPSVALNSCIKLLENTLIDNLGMIKVLMRILPRFKDDDMGQIPVLRLLSKCLQRYANQHDHGGSTNAAANSNSLGDDLKQCLLDGLSRTVANEYTVEAWVRLLCDCLPLFDTAILQHLIQISGCLCNQINAVFDSIQMDHDKKTYEISTPLVATSFYSFVDGLEKLLVSTHEKLQYEERRASAVGGSSSLVTTPGGSSSNNAAFTSSLQSGSNGHHSSPSGISSPPPTSANESGFLGNVISGVFAVESPIAKSQAANSRLTVILAFHDAIKVSFDIWKWTEKVGRQASDSDILLCSRLKSRMRRLLVRLYNLEPLETCERLIQLGISEDPKQVCKLIHVIDGGRPKITVPHLFNALSSCLNSNGGEDVSSQTSELTEHELGRFLVDYLGSVDNDAMEEIWPECIGFISRNVIPNHSMFKPVLPYMLRMVQIMANKLAKIKFGEQRKIRKDLSDVFVRLLNYAVNARSSVPDLGISSTASSSTHSLATVGGVGENSSKTNEAEDSDDNDSAANKYDNEHTKLRDEDVLIQTLIRIVPFIPEFQDSNEKQTSTMGVIMSSIISPKLKSKHFPANFSGEMVDLLNAVVRVPQLTKSWRSSVGDAFFEQRFMSMDVAQAVALQGVVSRWAQFDKDRVKDYVHNRLWSHGSSSTFISWSDSEASNRQTNLRRLAYLFLCGPESAYGLDIQQVVVRLEEAVDQKQLGHACMVVRALILQVDNIHLRPIWNLITLLLISIFTQVLDTANKQVLDLETLVNGCKLLDLLLCVGYENFRLNEWLFICDNMDAIFRGESSDSSSTLGLIDQISTSGLLPPISESIASKINFSQGDKKRPLLNNVKITKLAQLKPFFDQLSMVAYEQLYSLQAPDIECCKMDLIRDLFPSSS